MDDAYSQRALTRRNLQPPLPPARQLDRRNISSQLSNFRYDPSKLGPLSFRCAHTKRALASVLCPLASPQKTGVSSIAASHRFFHRVSERRVSYIFPAVEHISAPIAVHVFSPSARIYTRIERSLGLADNLCSFASDKTTRVLWKCSRPTGTVCASSRIRRTYTAFLEVQLERTEMRVVTVSHVWLLALRQRLPFDPANWQCSMGLGLVTRGGPFVNSRDIGASALSLR